MITSLKDDTYGGDTNNDGASTSPAPGDWGEIWLYGTGNLNLDHAIVRYGGGYLGWEHGTITAYITLYPSDGASVSISNSVIEHNLYDGVFLHDEDATTLSNLSITSSTIRNNNWNGVTTEGIGIGFAIIRGSSIYNSAGYGVYNGNISNGFDARYNYWGSDNGPAPYGQGDAINTYQEWDPICECVVTKPAVIFTPPLDSSGQIVGPPPAQTYGTPSTTTSISVADPVNVVFGNYTYQYTDLAFPTLGEGFTFLRTYNSASTDFGPLGLGWTHSYDIFATQPTTNTVVILREDGRKDMYTDAGGGNYLSPPGVYDTLRFVTDHFVLTRKDQAVYSLTRMAHWLAWPIILVTQRHFLIQVATWSHSPSPPVDRSLSLIQGTCLHRSAILLDAQSVLVTPIAC